MNTPKPSTSEDHGIAAVPQAAKRIYSVGISTMGVAEMRMAEANPDCAIIATTIDEAGLDTTRELVKSKGFDRRIELKIEDVAKPLPYEDGWFDYVYARLVLHYLTRQEQNAALAELHRVLRPGGKLFLVIRSDQNLDATQYAIGYDEVTGLTTYRSKPNSTAPEVTRKRYFHSEDSIKEFVTAAGFTIEQCQVYDENLFHDYERSVTVDHDDNLIELVVLKSD